MRSLIAGCTKGRRADCRAPFRYFRLSCSGRLGGAASGRYHVVIFPKRNPTKYRAVHVSVGLRSCVAPPNLRLSTQCQIQRQIAATKRASPRGTQRSPCWHSSGPLRDTIGRLGGAASGRYYVVIFTKRNPTKCSGRGYVSVGLRSCVAAPNLRLLQIRITW